MCIYRWSGGAVTTCIGTYIKWTMHAPLHVAPTHACATPSGAMAMDAPVHVALMNNIFIGCANAPGAYVRCFWKSGYFGKYFQIMVILEF